MAMSYLTSLNTQLFKNIAYVGSFEHFSVQPHFQCKLKSSRVQRYNCSDGAILDRNQTSNSSNEIQMLMAVIFSLTKTSSSPVGHYCNCTVCCGQDEPGDPGDLSVVVIPVRCDNICIASSGVWCEVFNVRPRHKKCLLQLHLQRLQVETLTNVSQGSLPWGGSD